MRASWTHHPDWQDFEPEFEEPRPRLPGVGKRNAAQHAYAGVVLPSAPVTPGAPFDFAAALDAATHRAPGQPLPAGLQTELESSAGVDLGDVRVHTDAAAGAAAHAMQARAYTVGRDIHFAPGQYDPSSAGGRHLIAHETAHTIQQRGAAPAVQAKLAVGAASDAAEVEADGFADAFLAGCAAAPLTAAPLGIARAPAVDSRREPVDAPPVLDARPGTLDFRDEYLYPDLESRPRAVTVTNRGNSGVTVDEITEFPANPRRDFRIHGAVSHHLQPGDQLRFEVAFHPSRVGDFRDVIMVMAPDRNGTPAAAATIPVHGTAAKRPDHCDYDTKECEQQKEAESAEAQAEFKNTTSPLFVAKHEVDELLRKWSNAAVRYQHELAAWLSVNWADFIKECGGDHHVAWTRGQFLNVVQTVAPVVAEQLTAAGVGAVLGSAVPGVGTVVGAVVGLLIDLVWGAISTAEGNREESKVAYDAAHNTGGGIANRLEYFLSEAGTAMAMIGDAYDVVRKRLWLADTAELVSDWKQWAVAETALVAVPVRRQDRTLCIQLRREWVLQRSARPGVASSPTNDDAFEKTKSDVFARNGEPGERRARRDLFIHQARYQWSKAGLDVDTAVTMLEQRLAAAEEAAGAGPRDPMHPDDADRHVAERITHQLQGFTIRFTASADPEQTKAHFAGTRDAPAYDGFFDKTFRLDCALRFARDGIVIYIDEFAYELKHHGRTIVWRKSP